jgi:hypothetical protein
MTGVANPVGVPGDVDRRYADARDVRASQRELFPWAV